MRFLGAQLKFEISLTLLYSTLSVCLSQLLYAELFTLLSTNRLISNATPGSSFDRININEFKLLKDAGLHGDIILFD
jgi:hypothetical protein